MTEQELRFDGKVAVVTGGGHGMGREHCLMLARRGAAVVVNDLGGDAFGNASSGEVAAAVAEEIASFGGRAIANHDSVSTADGPEAIVGSTVDAFGRVDIVVTNAGVAAQPSPFVETEFASVQRMIDVHTRGTWEVTRAAWRHFMAQGGGRVVCVTSSSGLFGSDGASFYGAAKTALHGMIRTLAIEGAGHDIAINALAPGARSRMSTATDPDWVAFSTEHQRPEFVAPAMAYLAHDSCPVTGRVFSCLGRRLAEVLVATTEGFFTSPDEWSPEAIRDNWERVIDRGTLYEPSSALDELAYAYRQMGVTVPSVAPRR